MKVVLLLTLVISLFALHCTSASVSNISAICPESVIVSLPSSIHLLNTL